MNGAHYHLIVNHVPIFCVLFGLLILIWGLFKKSHSINNIAFVLLIVGAIASYVALRTGHEAEHVLRQQSILNHEMHERVEKHEHEAENAYWLAIVTGVISIIGLFNSKFDRKIQYVVNGATVVAAAITLGLLIYTSYLGGAIRHTEAYEGNTTATLHTPHLTIQKRGAHNLPPIYAIRPPAKNL